MPLDAERMRRELELTGFSRGYRVARYSWDQTLWAVTTTAGTVLDLAPTLAAGIARAVEIELECEEVK